MNKILLWMSLVCLSCFFVGCTARSTPGQAAAGQTSPAQPAPIAPPGMQLGAPYTSGLNEPCYELLPVAGSFEPPQALCLRGQAWQTVPPVQTALPGKAPVAR